MPLSDAQKQNFMVIVRGSLAAGGSESQNTVNILTYRRTAFPVAFSGTAFITAFHANSKANWKAAVSASWTWVSTEVRCIDDAVEPSTTVAVGEVGGVAGDALPSYCAMVISKLTAFRGRSYRGRLYLAGVPESGNVNNALNAGHKILLDAVAVDGSALITDANANTFKPTVLSQKMSVLTTSPATVLATDITSMTARQVLGRMSSRKTPVL